MAKRTRKPQSDKPNARIAEPKPNGRNPPVVTKAAIRGILSDGKWHGIREFLVIAQKLSPERATRIYISSKCLPSRDHDAQVREGRRICTERVLNRMMKEKEIEVRGKKMQRTYRTAQLTPKQQLMLHDTIARLALGSNITIDYFDITISADEIRLAPKSGYIPINRLPWEA